MTRTITATIAAGVLACSGAATVFVLRDRAAPAAAATAVPTGTAPVQRTDIVQRQRVNGTLNYGATTPVSPPGGATPDQVQQARAAVNTAHASLTAAMTAAADTAAANQQAISQAQGPAAVAAAQQHAQQAQHEPDAQSPAPESACRTPTRRSRCCSPAPGWTAASPGSQRRRRG